MTDLYYRSPRLLILTILLIVVSGAFSIRELPRTEDPPLTARFATVRTPFPGATAERVEALVTEIVEEELQTFDELKVIDSTSRANISVVQLEIADEILAVDEVWSRVRDRLADIQAELPDGALPPAFDDDNNEAYTFFAAVKWTGGGETPHALLRRSAEAMQDELRDVPGTTYTQLFGAADEEVRVEVELERLAALGLSVGDLSRDIAARDAEVPAGRMIGHGVQLPLEVEGDPATLADLGETPIARAPGGDLVRLRDVATIERGIEIPRAEQVLASGLPAVTVAVRAANDIRTDQWAERLREQLDRFSATLPAGLELTIQFDQSRYVEQRFAQLWSNLALGTGLVFVFTFLLMGWRSSVIIGAALPLTVLLVLALMRTFGVPLHQMSLTGMIVALGILIDNAIIIVDELRHRFGRGGDRAAAVRAAVKALAVPLLGSTLTTVLAFLPIALMPGPAGEFVGPISLTVITALASSLALALTVIAALTAHLLPRIEDGGTEPRGWWRTGISPPALGRAYDRLLTGALRRPVLTLALICLVPFAGFAVFGQLTEQFFPPADRDQFQVQMSLPRAVSLSETEDAVAVASEVMLQHEDVVDLHWFLGTSAPSFYYNMIGGEDGSPFYAQALVRLRSSDHSTETIRDVQALLDRALPQAQTLALQLEQGPPFDAPIELRIYGPDLDLLSRLSDRARGILAQVNDITHTRATLLHGQPKLKLQLDESDVDSSGRRATSIARELQASLDGITGGSFREDTEELPIRVRLARDDRADTSALSSLDLLDSTATVPLSALGEFELIPEWSTIAHRKGRRVVTVQGFLQAGILPAAALTEFQQRLDANPLALPAGYRIEFGGESAERDDAVGKLLASAALLLVMMVATLVLSFQSFRLTALIGVIGAFTLGLGALPLYLFGFPFGFVAIVGTMGLIGLAINDSIVVLAAIREDPAARAGDREAIKAVVLRSTRHVLTTTVTTVAGFLPLLITGGRFWPPLAVVISGGVFGATLLALFLVPCAYALMYRPQSVRVTSATRICHTVSLRKSTSKPLVTT